MKDRLPGVGDKTAREQANPGGEEFEHPTLSLQPEPGVIVGGEFREGNIKVSVGKDDPRPDDLPYALQSVVGVGRGQGASDDEANRKINQRDLRPHPRGQTEGGSIRETRDVDGKRADQGGLHPRSGVRNKTPALSTSRVEEPEST